MPGFYDIRTQIFNRNGMIFFNEWNVAWFRLYPYRCSLPFVCISYKDSNVFPVQFNDVWLNNLLNIYFTCNRHAMKLCLTQLFLFLFPSVPWSVCVCLTSQRSQKVDTSWYSAHLCMVVPMGDPYASGTLSAFARVSRRQKHTVMCSLWYCIMYAYVLFAK